MHVYTYYMCVFLMCFKHLLHPDRNSHYCAMKVAGKKTRQKYISQSEATHCHVVAQRATEVGKQKR
jgi:hypothetical protein